MPAGSRPSGLLERRATAWIVLAVNMLVTLVLWRTSVDEFHRRAGDSFLYRAEKQQAALVDRMEEYQQVLRGGQGLFRASDWVSRDEWHRYVQSLQLDETLPGILGTGFAQIVPRDQLATHVLAVRAEGFPDYAIRPRGDRETYSSIIYLEPFAGRNLRAFGYDMLAEPVRREAMERARDTGEAALSGRVRLVQETAVDVQPGFLIYLPVYRNRVPLQTLAQRREALVGWVYSPFRAHDLMDRILADPRRDVEVEIYDGEIAPDRLLYRSESASRLARHTVDLPMAVAGHTWVGRYRSSVRFEAMTSSLQPLLILASGVMVSGLLFTVLTLLGRHSRRLEVQVRERTRELEVARDEAESANRAKTAFLATVSHELRTPLNSILGFTSLMLDDPDSTLSAAQRHHLGIVRQSGTQLLGLIEEILDISSIEAGHVALECEPVRLREVLEQQCEALRPAARDAHLELQVTDCDESLVVRADRRWLEQVIRNLLANGIKFTDHGSVTVRAQAEGETVRIEVIDTGIGIAPEEQTGLFRRFNRIRVPNRKIPAGTGLGLAICRRLVEAMGGVIGVDSRPAKGSRFWFTLPAG